MEQKPEVFALGQQHGDESRAPEGNEDEFGEYAEEVDEVCCELVEEPEVSFENVGDGEEDCEE